MIRFGFASNLLLLLALLEPSVGTVEGAEFNHFVNNGCWLPGVAMYYSQLVGSSNPMQDCPNTPAIIDAEYFSGPSDCKNDGNGNAIGWFYVDVKGSCDPQWGNVQPVSCSYTKGYQTWSGILWGIPYGRSWEDWCNNAWARVHGVFFNKPTRCINGHGINMWGEFDVPEPQCG